MGRGEHGEDGREVDVAKEEVEREEAQGDQVLRGIWKFSGQAVFLATTSLPGMDPILQCT